MNTQQDQRSTMMAQIIRPMFTSLPLPRGVDADELLGGYLVALEGMLPSTLKAVVIHLVKGTWHEEVKFCPRPPELANMVRQEQRRFDAMNRPKLPAPMVVVQPFKDLRITHRQRAQELQGQGYVRVAEGVSHEAFANLAKSRGIPAGSLHLWAIDEVWAPQAVSHLVDSSKVEAKKRQAQAASPEAMTEEEAEYWRQIDRLKDAKEVTPEQQGFRRRKIAEAEQVEAGMEDAA